MADRFYLPSSGSAAVSPAFSASWEITTSAARRPTDTTRADTSSLNFGHTDADNDDKDVLLAQYVSGNLSAGTIPAQTIKGQVLCRESASGNNLFLAIEIRAVSSDGNTVRGTLLSLTRDDTEISSATEYTNRSFSATSSEVTLQANDRLVIEIGAGGNPSLLGHDYNIRFGDKSGASELPEDDSTFEPVGEDDSDPIPWIEFTDGVEGGGGIGPQAYHHRHHNKAG